MQFDSCFDIIGPIMVGPSSSHTAGVASIGKFVHAWLGDLNYAEITLYGSLASTYQGHGSDKAIIGGLLGLSSRDLNIRSAYALAKDRQLEYHFALVPDAPPDYHPNTVQVEAVSPVGTLHVIGASIGGGVAIIYAINHQEASINLGTGGDIDTIVEKTQKEVSDV